MKMRKSILDTKIFSKAVQDQKINVFLCGPGAGAASYSMREYIRETLMTEFGARVYYGEELGKDHKISTSRVDLQTLEAQFAHRVDFTLLMLDSPGSIAELGTFSMIGNIRPRLFVVLANHFFEAKSYIARGPLSLIASYSPNNVMYFDPGNKEDVKSKLMYPICLYKFARHKEGHRYIEEVVSKFRSVKFESDSYLNYFEPIRKEFVKSVTLAAINILNRPTFAEIVRWLMMKPSDISVALSALFDDRKVEKVGRGYYRAVSGFADPMLSCFNTSELSKMRAELLAMS